MMTLTGAVAEGIVDQRREEFVKCADTAGHDDGYIRIVEHYLFPFGNIGHGNILVETGYGAASLLELRRKNADRVAAGPLDRLRIRGYGRYGPSIRQVPWPSRNMTCHSCRSSSKIPLFSFLFLFL